MRVRKPSAAAAPIPDAGRKGGAKAYLPAIRDILRENAKLRRENAAMRAELDRLREKEGGNV